MNTARIEELLEQLISKQDDIIYRLETLETVVGEKLGAVNEKLEESNSELSSINDELNWWGDKPSLAYRLLSDLETIKASVINIDTSISALDR